MDELNVELLVLWFLTGGAAAIMLLRLILKQYRRQPVSLGDYFTIGAIVSILLRGAVIHVAMVWGTNSFTPADRQTTTFTPAVIYQHEVGAKLTIVNRAFYAVYTWLQKCVIMCVLQHLLNGILFERVLKFYWATLGVTFLVVFIVTFTECHPFKLYYQVVPDPGTCAKGIIQLEVFSAFNIATDLMLIVLPLPQLIRMKRPLMDRLRLVGLFLVGLTIVAVTFTRLLLNVVLFHRSGQSHNVANVEIICAAFVANAPTIYGLLKMKGRKRGRAGAQYLPDSYIVSKSARGLGGNLSRSHDLGSDGFQSGDPVQSSVWVGKSRYGNESDEERMIELEDARPPNIHVTTTVSVT
ncbi:uncharacterized protein BP5553_08632 [Venustampulla echinocandica]|uniref:Rhodopsin domain-containing protein n=1 Tax=Venustampulla echinocandica TaxID=2656787 RepID=A0A370TES9_9HELO|nr:uncharacterized protein BP5553_08632 [Venustampulla echinocandica]RDL33193.1 hypothetical protein BP5553_08632 [Venustampulla echinocandica]